MFYHDNKMRINLLFTVVLISAMCAANNKEKSLRNGIALQQSNDAEWLMR